MGHSALAPLAATALAAGCLWFATAGIDLSLRTACNALLEALDDWATHVSRNGTDMLSHLGETLVDELHSLEDKR